MRERKLVLCRGLPASGKSTMAQTLSRVYNFSADQYFEERAARLNTTYEEVFDPAELGAAHALCQERTERSMKAGAPIIAVHNTFTELWEITPYFELAHKHGYRVQTIICEASPVHLQNPTHEVPNSVIEKMAARWHMMDPRLD